MFLFKKSEVTLDAFIAAETVGLNFPIAPASKFYPKEWKSYPKDIIQKANNNLNSKLTTSLPTIKHCNGITDLFSSGFIIPSWATVSIECLGDGQFNTSTSNIFPIECHDRQQFGSDIFKGYSHVKFISPWIITEKTGIKFLWSQPSWHLTNIKDNFGIPSAVVDYKYQFATNINCFQKYNSIIDISVGDPLVHMVPLTEKKVKLKVHIISEIEYHKINEALIQHVTFDNHRNLKYPKLKTSKCPFGFK